MSTIECADDIEELLKMVKTGIQTRKISEIADMSNENMINIHLQMEGKRLNGQEDTGTYNFHRDYYLKNGIDRDSIRQSEQVEILRANQEKETNAKFMPLIEALYNAVNILHNKSVQPPSILSDQDRLLKKMESWHY